MWTSLCDSFSDGETYTSIVKELCQDKQKVQQKVPQKSKQDDKTK